MGMEKQLRDLCEKHGLTCLSIMIYPGHVTVFPHWDDAQGQDCCCSSTGPTFETAFSEALFQIPPAKAA